MLVTDPCDQCGHPMRAGRGGYPWCPECDTP